MISPAVRWTSADDYERTHDGQQSQIEGLKRLPETRLEELPRMADFALWATACETAIWPAGTDAALARSRQEG